MWRVWRWKEEGVIIIFLNWYRLFAFHIKEHRQQSQWQLSWTLELGVFPYHVTWPGKTPVNTVYFYGISLGCSSHLLVGLSDGEWTLWHSSWWQAAGEMYSANIFKIKTLNNVIYMIALVFIHYIPPSLLSFTHVLKTKPHTHSPPSQRLIHSQRLIYSQRLIWQTSWLRERYRWLQG